MDWIRILLSRCAGLFGRRKVDEDLDQELFTHIGFSIEENRRRGMSEQEARTAALRAFGGITQAKEDYRMQSGLPFFDVFSRDLRFGFRQLRKSPGSYGPRSRYSALASGSQRLHSVLSTACCCDHCPIKIPIAWYGFTMA
jgi:hypothetical protein